MFPAHNLDPVDSRAGQLIPLQVLPCVCACCPDIRSFFDRMSHEWTMKFVQHRVADRILRLIQKWLKAGVMEEGHWEKAEAGTPDQRRRGMVSLVPEAP
jgi:hypothetical protein